jgi:hypothetical protein
MIATTISPTFVDVRFHSTYAGFCGYSRSAEGGLLRDAAVFHAGNNDPDGRRGDSAMLVITRQSA